MAEIKFNKAEKAAIVPKIQMYLSEELNLEVGQFDAEFLLDFFTEEIGPYYYNRGLGDAQAVLSERLESIGEAIYELEKPV
ncbi:hypothetical protein OLMES_0142 [Oleiphilus messinensis]|uniref:DUF2164 domain-containing protein n=1 Tax=Oleiphilus messinensis TaxID=141451 RepID=A0A1Y0I1W5_9GAMM|nr:DUF2164 domain-containing protein [Oleiphilus messinensis]ARU54250.1 hypothetical protein OLMES_0142 [Oleiphilus messinensis]